MEYLSHDCKIHRARQHLELLQSELRSSISHSDAYEIVNESEDVEVTHETRRIRFTRKVIFKAQIPTTRLGVLVGDIIGNIRSALDHVIYAISFSRDPDEFRDDRTTEFPIWDDPEGFRRAHRRRWGSLYEIRGIPPEAQAVVEGLQPYHRGKVSDDPLWILREMSNVDKHRNIHLATYSGAQISMDLSNIDPRLVIHSYHIRPPGIVESGAVLATMEVTAPNVNFAYTAMHLNRQFFFTVAFDYDTPMPDIWVLEGLNSLIDYAEGVVGALDTFIAKTA